LPDSWVASTRTIDMMFTGRTYSAEEGASLGFSLYLIEDGKGLIKGLELAKRIPAVLGNFAVIPALPRITRSGYRTVDRKADGRDRDQRW
jgi:enoyl-CoA hydratase/carnithine racemase